MHIISKFRCGDVYWGGCHFFRFCSGEQEAALNSANEHTLQVLLPSFYHKNSSDIDESSWKRGNLWEGDVIITLYW